MTLIDLSHAIADGSVTYPGLPAPRITDYLSREASKARYAPGTTFHIARIEMVGNSGTYVDAPSHRFEGRADLSELRLEQLADLDGLTIDATGASRIIDGSFFAGRDLRGKAVLVHTGWSRHFGTPAYGEGSPYLTSAAAELLVQAGAALVGIDSLNIDDTADLARPAHTLLLDASIPIVEHMTNLAALPASGFRFFAVPPRWRGVASFPVRAFAIL